MGGFKTRRKTGSGLVFCLSTQTTAFHPSKVKRQVLTHGLVHGSGHAANLRLQPKADFQGLTNARKKPTLRGCLIVLLACDLAAKRRTQLDHVLVLRCVLKHRVSHCLQEVQGHLCEAISQCIDVR